MLIHVVMPEADHGDAGLVSGAIANPYRPLQLRTDLPAVLDMEVEVLRGRTIDIIISATVPSVQTPEFILRSRPEFGFLGEMERVPGQPLQMRVRYTIPENTTAVEDQFSFAARLPDGPMSATATVRIRIREPQPFLEGESLFIDHVPLGGERTGMLVVSNSGEGVWRGSLDLPAPWSGPEGEIVIQPGQTLQLPIRYRALDLEMHRHPINWQPERPDSTVILIGRGIPSLSLTPSQRLILNMDAASGRRAGQFLVEAMMPMTVKLESPEAARMGLPEEIQVNGKEPTVVPLVLAESDLAPLATSITASSEFMSLMIEVTSEPVPARLVMTPLPEDRVLDLGKMNLDQETSIHLSLHNTGGVSMKLRFEPELPAFIIHPVESIELAPGQQADLVAGLRATNVGIMRRRISIDTGAGVESFTLVAEVEAPDAVPEKPVVPRMGTGWDHSAGTEGNQRALRKLAASFMVDGVRLEPVQENQSLPAVSALHATAVGRTWLDLKWPNPAYNPGSMSPGGSRKDLNYMIEIARVMPHPENGEIGYYWIRVPEKHFRWKISRDGQLVEARLTDLPRQSPVVARVAVRDSDGAIGPLSPIASAITREGRRFPWRGLGFSLLLLAAVVLGFLTWQQRRRF